jgi:hypothetical protein
MAIGAWRLTRLLPITACRYGAQTGNPEWGVSELMKLAESATVAPLFSLGFPYLISNFCQIFPNFRW